MEFDKSSGKVFTGTLFKKFYFTFSDKGFSTESVAVIHDVMVTPCGFLEE